MDRDDKIAGFYVYNLAKFDTGTMLTGYDREYRRDEVAELTFHTEGEGYVGEYVMSALGPLRSVPIGAWGERFAAPSKSTMFVSAD